MHTGLPNDRRQARACARAVASSRDALATKPSVRRQSVIIIASPKAVAAPFIRHDTTTTIIMGNKTSSPPPPSADKAPVEREAGLVDSPVASPPPSPQPRPVSLHLESPNPTRAVAAAAKDVVSPSFGLLAPTININVSPPPLSTGAESPISGRATSSSPSPTPSPRSQISAGSSVTSAGGRAASFFWNVQEQYYNRKIARRQSQLESAGRLGRPCCFTLQSITLQGTFPSTAQVQAEITVLFEKTQPYLNHISELPPLRTSPRPPLRPGQVNIGGETDLVLLPSVTSSSILSITVLLDGIPIGNVHYPLSEITATLRPTELRLTPAGADGKKTPRSRSPSSSPLRRRQFSSASPTTSTPFTSSTADLGLESLPFRTPSTSPPPPTTAGSSSSSSSSIISRPSSSPQAAGGGGDGGGGAAAAEEGPPTVDAVWGEVVFYDNRSSGVGWVDLVEEGGKPVSEQRLLVVTPQSFALMESPHCILGQEGYSMTQVRHVEPKGHASLLPEKADDLPRNISSGTTTPPISSSNSSNSSTRPQSAGGGEGGGGGVGGGGALVTVSVSCPKRGESDILLALDSEEDARRWTQLLKRAAHEAAFGGAEKS